MAELLREIALKYAKKQPQQVDQLTEAAPILDSMTFQESTHGFSHAYEELDDVQGGSFVDIDASLPTVDAIGKLKKHNLAILGGIHEAGEDKLNQLGGMAKYLATKMPAILAKTGMTAETLMIYNRLQAFALEQAKCFSATETQSGNKYYSIMAVRWQDGNMTGLYDPNGFGKGALMDVLPLSNGSVYKNSSNVLVKGVRLKSYFDLLTASAKNISCIFNIDATAEAPDGLAALIDNICDEARVGTPGRIYLYMHQKMKTKLNKFKASKLNLIPADQNMKRSITAWEDVPIITSYNFLPGTEAPVSVS